jgi:hypothetical protein
MLQVKVWFQNRRMKWRHQEEAKRSNKDEQARRQSTISTVGHSSKSDDVMNASITGSSCSDDDSSSTEDVCDALSPSKQCKFTSAQSNIVAMVSPLSCQLINENDNAPSGGRNFRKPATVMSVADILDLRKSSMDCIKSSRNVPADWNQ